MQVNTGSEQKRFCIVLTNNSRMIQSASRMSQSVIIHVPNEKTPSERHSLPQLSPSKDQEQEQLNTSVEQQVPLPTQFSIATIPTSDSHAYEKELEADFQAQLQPILQTYLRKTRRTNPINCVFDMSSCVDNYRHLFIVLISFMASSRTAFSYPYFIITITNYPHFRQRTQRYPGFDQNWHPHSQRSAMFIPGVLVHFGATSSDVHERLLYNTVRYQIQQSIRTYLQHTRQPYPIHLVFDMCDL